MSVDLNVNNAAVVVQATKEPKKEEKKASGTKRVPDWSVPGIVQLKLYHPRAFASRREREAARALQRRVFKQEITAAKASFKIIENHFGG